MAALASLYSAGTGHGGADAGRQQQGSWGSFAAAGTGFVAVAVAAGGVAASGRGAALPDFAPPDAQSAAARRAELTGIPKPYVVAQQFAKLARAAAAGFLCFYAPPLGASCLRRAAAGFMFTNGTFGQNLPALAA